MASSTQQTTSNGERLIGGGVGALVHALRAGAAKRPSLRGDAERLARGLGWLSVALGIAHFVAPRALARMIGLPGNQRHGKVMRAIGLRELTAGIGILAQPRSAGWLRTRVGSDMTDLALLGSTLSSRYTRRSRIAIATAAVLGITALDALAARRLGGGDRANARRKQGERATHATRAITVNRPLEEVYRFWRNFENLPRFASHLESVRVLDERRSHWIARAGDGAPIEWDARIFEDRPSELIAWKSLDGVTISGSARFNRAPGGRGTEVHVEMRYEPAGGVVHEAIARIFGAGIEHLLAADLRRFKQLIETGEIVKSDASVHRGPHPAQPPSERSFPQRNRIEGSPELQGEVR
jgi:uncharacterized membrane protein